MNQNAEPVMARMEKGNPAMVKAMGVKPIGGTAEADTKAAVTKGKNKMKPITSVTGKQLDDVAAYVASLT